MTRYVLAVGYNGLDMYLADEYDGDNGDYFFALSFDLANHLDESVALEIALKSTLPQVGPIEGLNLDLKFIDQATGDIVYAANGAIIADDNDQMNFMLGNSSITSIMEAMDDFSDVSMEVYRSQSSDVGDLACFNEYGTLGRNKEVISIPSGPMPMTESVFDIVTNQDIEPSSMYMQFTNDFGLFTELLQIANKINVDLWVELDPSLTTDEAMMLAQDLAPFDHHVRLLWSPIRARPLDAVGLKGKKIPRHVGGYVLGQLLKRRAQTNSQGVPPLHIPIAGFDYPIPFLGIEQNPGVILNDFTRKMLAECQLNVVERMKSANGVRFVIGDCLTANGDNTSALKLSNVSDISMFIDNRLKMIIHRHLLKPTDTFIEDALEECGRFLDACTTKERPLLKKSSEFSGFYSLSIIPREDRPYDAVDVKCKYHPQGAVRAAYLDTTVTKGASRSGGMTSQPEGPQPQAPR